MKATSRQRRHRDRLRTLADCLGNALSRLQSSEERFNNLEGILKQTIHETEAQRELERNSIRRETRALQEGQSIQVTVEDLVEAL